jgi:hypothetical protein
MKDIDDTTLVAIAAGIVVVVAIRRSAVYVVMSAQLEDLGTGNDRFGCNLK